MDIMPPWTYTETLPVVRIGKTPNRVNGGNNMGAVRITPNLYAVTSQIISHPTDCASYLIDGEEPVLIDCGTGRGHAKLLENIAETGVPVRDLYCVIGTHGHFDHLAGITALRQENPRLMLAMHDADADQIENADQKRTCADWFFGDRMEPEKVNIRLQDGYVFNVCGYSFRIISAPGHTPGSIFILAEIDGRRILFIGDAFVPGNDIVGSSYSDWVTTINLLPALEFDMILPGHISQFFSLPMLAPYIPFVPRSLADTVYNLVVNNLPKRLYWEFSSYQYSQIFPKFAKLPKSSGKS